MIYDPCEDAEDNELNERKEAEDISYRYNKIPIINWVKKWPLEKFNKIMRGLMEAYKGDNDGI